MYELDQQLDQKLNIYQQNEFSTIEINTDNIVQCLLNMKITQIGLMILQYLLMSPRMMYYKSDGNNDCEYLSNEDEITKQNSIQTLNEKINRVLGEISENVNLNEQLSSASETSSNFKLNGQNNFTIFRE